MKKILFPLFTLVLLAGCVNVQTTDPAPSADPQTQVETQANLAKTPLEALAKEGLFPAAGEGDYPEMTDLKLEKMNPSDSSEQPWLKVVIKQDGFMDDSVKSETYELKLKEQSGSWIVSDKKLVERECYRGEVDGLCL